MADSMTSLEPSPIDMKKLLCAVALISVISCGPKKQKSANLSLNELPKEALTTLSDSVRKETVAVKSDLVYPEQGLFATEGRYLLFGKPGYRDREFQEDTLLFPPIEGLVHRSAYAMRIMAIVCGIFILIALTK